MRFQMYILAMVGVVGLFLWMSCGGGEDLVVGDADGDPRVDGDCDAGAMDSDTDVGADADSNADTDIDLNPDADRDSEFDRDRDADESMCGPGFHEVDGGCADIDECTEGLAACDVRRATCINIDGWYICECFPLFIDVAGDGSNCDCPIDVADCDRELTNGCEARAPCFGWVRSCGGMGDDLGLGVTVDTDGNVYGTGSFEGVANIEGHLLTSAGHADAFVVSYARDGSFRWADRQGGLGDESGEAATSTAVGDIVVAGQSLLYASYATDGLLLRLRVVGDHAYSGLTTSGDGTVWAVGGFNRTVTIDTTVLTGIADEILISHFAGDGSHLWSGGFGGADSEGAAGVGVDSGGNIYIVANTRGAVDLGGGPLAHRGATDVILASYFPDGRHRWSRTFGGSGQDFGRAIAVDDADGVYITGSFERTAVFGGATMVAASGQDIFVAAYTRDGAHRWSRGFGAPGSQKGQAISADQSGNLLLTGYFSGSFSLGGGTLVGEGIGDIFIASLRSDGAYRWSRRFGGPGWNGGTAIVGDLSGRIYVVGRIEGSADFGGHIVSSEGATDAFILQLFE